LLCQKYFECLDIRTLKTKSGVDGGIDILLYKDDTPNPYAIVQCKVRASEQVGVSVARELYGVMATLKLKHCMVMTNSDFTSDALNFARINKEIKLVSGADFWVMIRKLNQDKQDLLDHFLSSRDYLTPTCPKCEIKLVLRKGRNGTEFWGCKNYGRTYNRCRYTLKMNKYQQPINGKTGDMNRIMSQSAYQSLS